MQNAEATETIKNDKSVNGQSKCEMFPVEQEMIDEEESQEGAQAKRLRSPAAPSRQEMLEHNLTHYPFRS